MKIMEQEYYCLNALLYREEVEMTIDNTKLNITMWLWYFMIY